MAMTLRLTDDEAEALRKRAEHEGRSMQEVAREAIRGYVDWRNRRELLDELFDKAAAEEAELLDRLSK
jgi:predicted transcriptional regulator